MAAVLYSAWATPITIQPGERAIQAPCPEHARFWNCADQNIMYNDDVRFEWREKLGRGASCTVYRARIEGTNETVAVKVLNVRRGPMREVMANLAVLHAPNVLHLKDIVLVAPPGSSQSSSQFGLVYETVDGRSRSSLNAADEPTFRHYLRQLVNALAYAHSAGVQHRDLELKQFITDKYARLFVQDWGDCSAAYRVVLPFHHKWNYEDMFRVGTLITSMWLKRTPLDCVGGNSYKGIGYRSLQCLINLLGTKDLKRYFTKYSHMMSVAKMNDPRSDTASAVKLMKMMGDTDRQDFSQFSSSKSSPMLLDFLDKLLRYDPEERMNASQALAHPYLATASNLTATLLSSSAQA